jgi:large subunit ribosomal protein L17
MTIRKLGRKKEHRERTLRNLATSLVLYEKINTTQAKAKAVIPMVERLITHARANDVNARRYAKALLFDTNAVTKLFEDITSRVGTRTSGFVRLTKIGTRPGDGAPMAQLEVLLMPLEEVLQQETNTKVKVRKTASKPAEQEVQS